MIAACVVDASVGVKLFLQEPGSGNADRLFAGLGEHPGARFYVPDLFFVECASILWKYVQRFGYPPENARQDVDDLRSLALRSVSTADLIASALGLAREYEITAEEACYAALALQTGLPLVTADGSLVRKLAEGEVETLDLMAL